MAGTGIGRDRYARDRCRSYPSARTLQRRRDASPERAQQRDAVRAYVVTQVNESSPSRSRSLAALASHHMKLFSFSFPLARSPRRLFRVTYENGAPSCLGMGALVWCYVTK